MQIPADKALLFLWTYTVQT